MAYPPQYIAMIVGAVRTLVGTENMHLRDAIARVARQMNLDAALVDSWVKQSPEYTAREDATGAARRSGTSANKRSAEHEQGVKAREKANASPFPRATVKRAYGVSDRGAKVTGIRPRTSRPDGLPGDH
ncbi:chorismate mutase [Rothia mucilaginosa]|uniref:chorismate mutase n=1 Tax=Rothia mucilaginosa TaxID=43675 RepID=UPI00288A610F|nr:chorismate mutase [Rothia mucilaginosa]